MTVMETAGGKPGGTLGRPVGSAINSFFRLGVIMQTRLPYIQRISSEFKRGGTR
jgi:hypothetical protein